MDTEAIEGVIYESPEDIGGIFNTLQILMTPLNIYLNQGEDKPMTLEWLIPLWLPEVAFSNFIVNRCFATIHGHKIASIPDIWESIKNDMTKEQGDKKRLELFGECMAAFIRYVNTVEFDEFMKKYLSPITDSAIMQAYDRYKALLKCGMNPGRLKEQLEFVLTPATRPRSGN